MSSRTPREIVAEDRQPRDVLIRRRPTLFRLLAFLSALAVSTMGCTTWRASAGSPREALADNRNGVVRAVLADSSVYEIAEPRIFGDSIIGRNQRRDRVVRVGDITLDTLTYSRVVLPLPNVSRIEVRRFNVVRSLLVVLGTWVTATVLFADFR